MRQSAIRRRRSRRLNAALFAASSASAIGAFAAQAQAQTPRDPISYCRDNSDTDKEHIACLEAAVAALAGTQKSAQAPASPPQSAPDEADSEAATVAATVPSDPEPDEEREAQPVVTGLGAEQVIAKQDRETKRTKEERKEKRKKGEVSAVVIDFARTNGGRLILVLDNGQVWAQRDSDLREVRLQEGEEYEVVIKRGAFSGYRIDFVERNKIITAERIK